MTFGRKFRIQAVFCAFAVVVCELISLPFTTMNICDDGIYIHMARIFADTGHIVYPGWGATMMGAQLCMAAAFIKLFGSSATSIRMSTLLLAAIAAFFFQRSLVRTGSSERNATLGTLAAVISPMYLMLSGTFMTDIPGFLAITLCLYGCVRAVQEPSDRYSIVWIFFAVVTCVVFGTSRQIAWLGNLVMVPCTLWLLRSRRRVVLAGAVATALAFLSILACTHWLAKQPYIVPVPLIVTPFPMKVAWRQLTYILLEIPFLVLPVIAVFTPRIFRTRPPVKIILLTVLAAYVVLAFASRRHPDPFVHLEPTAGNPGSWVTFYGVFATVAGTPRFLDTKSLVVLTILCIGGLLGVIAVATQPSRVEPFSTQVTNDPSWKQIGILLLPFSIAYLILLVAAVGTTLNIFDRYALGLLGPAMIVLIRLYQERIQQNLPPATIVLIIIMGAYGVIVTHNNFALDRARVDLANELHAHGIPYTSIDGSWDYNLDTELRHSNHINNPRIINPAGAYVPQPPPAPGYCQSFWSDQTPHVRGIYGIAFDPNYCHGPASFPPVQYRPWPFRTPINLYAIRYAPSAQ